MNLMYGERIRRDPSAAERRIQTADHEAIHCATAVALGWTLGDSALEGADGGWCRPIPPAGRDRLRVKRERLAITIAPRTLGDQPAGSDARDAYQLAREIVAPGRECTAPGREIRAEYERAADLVLELADSPVFQRARRMVAFGLHEYGELDSELLATVRRLAENPEAETTALARTPAPKPARKRGCSGCGCSYTPPSRTGKCPTCRGGVDG